MRLKRKYCSECGQKVVTRQIAGRTRQVCPACETIFYENPLPVAAALVMNDRREVLLVRRKRQPHRGKWCLPMGFAELGETVAEAARRELHEEAGIDGRMVRLLDADSYRSSHYGDLLIVTFELEKVGGREQAGDDAEDVAYFPIAAHPPLAFSANEKALQVCLTAHRESWAIQDSFASLQGAGTQGLVSDALVATIQERAEEIARRWLDDVRSSPTTPSYRCIAPQELLDRAATAISQFGRWFAGDEASPEVREFYRQLARERKGQGFRLDELLSSLMLLKKHVWTFARSQGTSANPLDVYRMLELDRRMAEFFDRAMYHAARGFDAESVA